MQVKQGKSPFSPLLWFLSGAALGLVTSYFFDPVRGKRRRIQAKDQIAARGRDLVEGVEKIAADLRNRAYGSYIEYKNHQHPHEVSDEILNQKIRSVFGRKIKHARAIKTSVLHGVVTLSGPILANEVHSLLRSIKKVAGVRDIINNLEVHEYADGISDLQGSGPDYLQ